MDVQTKHKSDIVVMDPNPDVRELVKIFLQREKIEIHGVSNGSQFLKSMENFDPDLILLGVEMQNPTGWRVLRTAKEKNLINSEPVLILSEIEDDEYLLKKEEIKWIWGHVKKPIDKENLLHEVKNKIDLKKKINLIKNQITEKEGNNKKADIFVRYIQFMKNHEFILRKLKDIQGKKSERKKQKIKSLVKKEKSIIAKLERETKLTLEDNELSEYSSVSEKDLSYPYDKKEKKIFNQDYELPPTKMFEEIDLSEKNFHTPINL